MVGIINDKVEKNECSDDGCQADNTGYGSVGPRMELRITNFMGVDGSKGTSDNVSMIILVVFMSRILLSTTAAHCGSDSIWIRSLHIAI